MSKRLLWLHGEVKTPPLSLAARREIGFLLRLLQEGEMLSLPHSRPMPSIGPGCHELRVNDQNKSWRLFYALDHKAEAIVILDLIEKKTQATPQETIDLCLDRLKRYETAKTQSRKK